MGLFDYVLWECKEPLPHQDDTKGKTPVLHTKSFAHPWLGEYRVTERKKLEYRQSQQCFSADPEDPKNIKLDWEFYWTPVNFDGTISCLPDNFNSDYRYLLNFKRGKLVDVNCTTTKIPIIIHTAEFKFRPLIKMDLEDFIWKDIKLKRTYSDENAEKLITRLCKKWSGNQFTYSIKSECME